MCYAATAAKIKFDNSIVVNKSAIPLRRVLLSEIFRRKPEQPGKNQPCNSPVFQAPNGTLRKHREPPGERFRCAFDIASPEKVREDYLKTGEIFKNPPETGFSL